VASFETLLTKELEKVAIIVDLENLSMIEDVIKVTTRMNEINREAIFCVENEISFTEKEE